MKLKDIIKTILLLALLLYGFLHPEEKSPLGPLGWLGLIGLISILLAGVIEIPLRYWKAKRLLAKFPSLWEQVDWQNDKEKEYVGNGNSSRNRK